VQSRTYCLDPPAIGRHQMLERGLAFLQKPFSAVALAQKVREVLG
jgi:hypothetical protein